MTQITLTHRIEELLELEETIDAMKAEAETIRNIIKDEMSFRGVDEIAVDDYVVRWVDVLSSRFDTKRFKTEMGEKLYKEYTKEVSSKRFSISH